MGRRGRGGPVSGHQPELWPETVDTGTVSDPTNICPCDTGRPYETCCGPIHEGRPAATAVALMRSRYSAYALGLTDYLLETWHPNTRPETIDPEPNLRWTGLIIEHSGAGKAWDDEGMVSFSAKWREDGQIGVMREVSSFLRVDGRWFYVNGIPHT